MAKGRKVGSVPGRGRLRTVRREVGIDSTMSVDAGGRQLVDGVEVDPFAAPANGPVGETAQVAPGELLFRLGEDRQRRELLAEGVDLDLGDLDDRPPVPLGLLLFQADQLLRAGGLERVADRRLSAYATAEATGGMPLGHAELLDAVNHAVHQARAHEGPSPAALKAAGVHAGTPEPGQGAGADPASHRRR